MYASMWNFRLKSWPMGQRATISEFRYAGLKQQLSLSLWYVNPERVLVKHSHSFSLLSTVTFALLIRHLPSHTHKTHSRCVYNSKTVMTVTVSLLPSGQSFFCKLHTCHKNISSLQALLCVAVHAFVYYVIDLPCLRGHDGLLLM